MRSAKIHPITALLLCVNTIVGAGLFVNIALLGRQVGPHGWCTYLLGTFFLLPIALTISHLSTICDASAGMYSYPKTFLGNYAGVVSGWCYFLSKTSSAALLVHSLSIFIQNRWIPSASLLILDLFFILMFISFHAGGVRLGGSIQYFFFALKLFPILFLLIAGSFCFSFAPFTSYSFSPSALFSSLPSVIFAFASFELVCSIIHLIDTSKCSPRLIILGSFFTVSAIYAVVQFISSGALTQAEIIATPLYTIIAKGFSHAWIGSAVEALIYLSISGGAFTLIGSNGWNVYYLAKDEWFPPLFAKLSETGIPLNAIFFKGLAAFGVLFFSQDLVALQNMFVTSLSVSFFLTCLSVFTSPASLFVQVIGLSALASCFYLCFVSVSNVLAAGVSLSFLFLLVGGLVAGVVRKLFFS